MSGEGNGTPLQYSCLENPMDGGAWWAAVHGVAKSQTWLSDFTFTFHFPALEKEMATHSSVLAWRTPGMGEPGGLPSVGSHRVGHDWSDLAAAKNVHSLWEINFISRTDIQRACTWQVEVLIGWVSILIAWNLCWLTGGCWTITPQLFQNEKFLLFLHILLKKHLAGGSVVEIWCCIMKADQNRKQSDKE